MKVLVYTARRWLVSARRMFRALGVEPDELTCPPLTAETFPYLRMERYDALYFRLHGLPNQPYMYGASFLRPWGATAFSLERLRNSGASFRGLGVRVFFEGCYASLTGIPQAFAALGALEVYAAASGTRNSPLRVGPAGQVGQAVLRAWLNEADAEWALAQELARQGSEMEFVAAHGGKRFMT